jgi:hypothetical protein
MESAPGAAASSVRRYRAGRGRVATGGQVGTVDVRPDEGLKSPGISRAFPGGFGGRRVRRSPALGSSTPSPSTRSLDHPSTLDGAPHLGAPFCCCDWLGPRRCFTTWSGSPFFLNISRCSSRGRRRCAVALGRHRFQVLGYFVLPPEVWPPVGQRLEGLGKLAPFDGFLELGPAESRHSLNGIQQEGDAWVLHGVSGSIDE